MTTDQDHASAARHWLWWLAFALLALYVAARLGVFALWDEVSTADGIVRLPNTFASVDHPFHIARAEILWREITSGQFPRWIGQHQGGYPVEYYPFGEAWLEIAVRAFSLGTLPAAGSHTIAVIVLFLLPGVAFVALVREDRLSPAVGLLALTLHIALPGSWYDGGYTELVQWGLVTNVAGAVASLLMLPALIRFLSTGAGRPGAAAAALAAFAIYCNPRAMLGLAALGLGAWIASVVVHHHLPPSPGSTAGYSRSGSRGRGAREARRPTLRLAVVALIAALLAAPELMSLARFGNLYTFVQYSGYEEIGDYIATALQAVSWPVVILAMAGVALALISRARLATTSTAIALIIYVVLTAAVAFVPRVSALAPQLEPTRLMPLQRLLTLYLAAVAVWMGLSRLGTRFAPGVSAVPPVAATLVALAILVVQTRPLPGTPPDPASPLVPPASLYLVAMSAQPQQADLEAAVRLADTAAPGTAILVLGSALAWHQQLWAPLWTERPLYYDNWLWYWRPGHAGTPRYRFQAGHHYPDPEQTLRPDYLARHGIGAVVVTGPAQEAAVTSPLLSPLRKGVYDAYLVRDPVTTVTFGDQNAVSTSFHNERIEATAEAPSASIVARINWYPRWQAVAGGNRITILRRPDGYLDVGANPATSRIDLRYTVQPLDWLARGLAAAGLASAAGLVFLPAWGPRRIRRWYAPRSRGDARKATGTSRV